MRFLGSITLLALAVSTYAAAPKAAFVENKGQWPDHVLYRALIPGGAVFVERSAFTYVLISDSPLRHHGLPHDGHDHSQEGKAHAYRVHFEGGQAQAWEGRVKQPHYESHFHWQRFDPMGKRMQCVRRGAAEGGMARRRCASMAARD
ncbi:MAG: hypothetical protein IPJ85_07580 [Flavobacteriales bacterium]|nr:hypothetical protein [Flavobacteriales bacterium]